MNPVTNSAAQSFPFSYVYAMRYVLFTNIKNLSLSCALAYLYVNCIINGRVENYTSGQH